MGSERWPAFFSFMTKNHVMKLEKFTKCKFSKMTTHLASSLPEYWFDSWKEICNGPNLCLFLLNTRLAKWRFPIGFQIKFCAGQITHFFKCYWLITHNGAFSSIAVAFAATTLQWFKAFTRISDEFTWGTWQWFNEEVNSSNMIASNSTKEVLMWSHVAKCCKVDRYLI